MFPFKLITENISETYLRPLFSHCGVLTSENTYIVCLCSCTFVGEFNGPYMSMHLFYFHYLCLQRLLVYQEGRGSLWGCAAAVRLSMVLGWMVLRWILIRCLVSRLGRLGRLGVVELPRCWQWSLLLHVWLWLWLWWCIRIT